ncbi:nitrilase family protein [Bizionia saleffrena]|uniref:Omega-amidase YafV n=1 Tax=Bizionia saleffrena TaxID=291189 RepID=A0A8H2LKH2_9FLAO|nr:nitrilase family protein [Bizionia saleffrena]TYB71799.1 nitrilase family protein [Bizionia saleffrena]
MSDTLKIVTIQSDLVWENPEQNREQFGKKIKAIAESVDIIVLPEMFTSGFTMHPEHVAETMHGKTIKWLQALAKDKDAAITGSLVIKETDAFYNRMVFVHPNGDIEIYNKRHTFTLAGEEKAYYKGEKQLIVSYKNWRICPLVCYDLRFPVWARNTQNYDVLIYVANWPKVRIKAWDVLLQARAIENMSYCVGVNRVGFDNKNNEYSGHTAVYNVLGEKLSETLQNIATTEMVTLYKCHIEKNRRHLGFLKDRDNFNLIM